MTMRQDTSREQKISQAELGGLYTLDFSAPSKRDETALATARLQLWQERMFHVHQAGVLSMARNKDVDKYGNP